MESPDTLGPRDKHISSQYVYNVDLMFTMYGYNVYNVKIMFMIDDVVIMFTMQR